MKLILSARILISLLYYYPYCIQYLVLTEFGLSQRCRIFA